jgi:thiazolinyl imide reductase
MSMSVDRRRPRVVVCGTKFGRVYLAAFRSPDFPFELAGILARGSMRSRACARYYDVPLFTHPDQLPADVDIACVVVGAAISGGLGAELAQALMARGIHVLQEHPLHHDELAECLRHAHCHGVTYRLNTHYIHVEPVRRFITAARALFRQQRPLFVDAACAFQVAFTLFDILGQALGGVRPWAFTEPPPQPNLLTQSGDIEAPFRSLDGMIAGVPLTLRIQQEMDPGDPDNYSHFFHRITFGTEGGNITLVNTHGPMLWCPRPHMPPDLRDAIALDDSTAEHLNFSSATPLGPAEGPTYREVLGSLWPAAVRRAMLYLRRAILEDEDPRRQGQYYLTLCRLTQDANARCGPLQLRRRTAPRILSGDDMMAVAMGDDANQLA